MTLTKKDVRTLAARLAKADEGLQLTVAKLNEYPIIHPLLVEAKVILLCIQSEVAEVKKVLQEAGEKEVKE